MASDGEKRQNGLREKTTHINIHIHNHKHKHIQIPIKYIKTK